MKSYFTFGVAVTSALLQSTVLLADHPDQSDYQKCLSAVFPSQAGSWADGSHGPFVLPGVAPLPGGQKNGVFVISPKRVVFVPTSGKSPWHIAESQKFQSDPCKEYKNSADQSAYMSCLSKRDQADLMKITGQLPPDRCEKEKNSVDQSAYVRCTNKLAADLDKKIAAQNPPEFPECEKSKSSRRFGAYLECVDHAFDAKIFGERKIVIDLDDAPYTIQRNAKKPALDGDGDDIVVTLGVKASRPGGSAPKVIRAGTDEAPDVWTDTTRQYLKAVIKGRLGKISRSGPGHADDLGACTNLGDQEINETVAKMAPQGQPSLKIETNEKVDGPVAAPAF